MAPPEQGLGCFHRVFLEAAAGLGLPALEGMQGSWRGRLRCRCFLEHTGDGDSRLATMSPLWESGQVQFLFRP